MPMNLIMTLIRYELRKISSRQTENLVERINSHHYYF
uniref:Uncharacterized protein n=1 Tax=Anguilla anguilla TaxID=7936 RepID=A0A0E9PRD8_ANGAN